MKTKRHAALFCSGFLLKAVCGVRLGSWIPANGAQIWQVTYSPGPQFPGCNVPSFLSVFRVKYDNHLKISVRHLALSGCWVNVSVSLGCKWWD